MSNEDIIRAWKDEEYRNSLSEEQRAQLPQNPAGLIELTDAEMEGINGGALLAQTKNDPICNITAKTKDPTTDCKPNTHILLCQKSIGTGSFSI
ncbi:mersacidin/lichenicidin family type 2 lantibiotic [Nostoc sp. CHAB 5824]|nr:mersacidin/lichenicidin family type 2 lantibiotic [Nostoc sp. CHAB 5824]